MGRVEGSEGPDMAHGMMFSVVISKIDLAWCPCDLEHVLGHTVLKPVEPHIDCFAAFLFYSIVENAFSSAVVGAEWSTVYGLLVA